MQTKLLFACLALPLTASGSFAIQQQQQYIGTAFHVPMARAQGMFSGAPLGLQLTNNVMPGSEQSLLIRKAGITTGTLIPWTTTLGNPGADFPDYSPGALFGHWVPGAIGESSWDPADTPELGGMSTGGDVTPPVDLNGVMLFNGPLKWYSLSISLSEKSRGQANTLINAMSVDGSTNANIPGSDGHIYSYMAEGSTGIAAGHVNTVRLDYARQQLSLTPTGAIHPGVKAIDWGMGRIATTFGESPSQMQPTRNRFYFTLTSHWLNTHNPSYSGYPAGFEWTPATIYEMEWDAVAGWSDPEVAYSRADLIDPSISNAEIDALSVFGAPLNQVIGTKPRRVVFSLTNAARSNENGVESYVDQILISQSHGANVASKPLSVDTGSGVRTFSQQFGLDPGDINDPEGTPDDVDSTCSQDPYSETVANQQNQAYLAPDTDLANPLQSSTARLDDVSMSMSRIVDGSDAQMPETLVISASGGDRGLHALNYVGFWFQLVEVDDNHRVSIISEGPSVLTEVLAGDNSVEIQVPLVRPTTQPNGHYEMRAQAIHVGVGPGMSVGLSTSWVCALKL